MKKISQKQKNRIIFLYKKGSTAISISRIFKINRGTVMRIVSKAGVTKNHRYLFSKEQQKLISRLYLEGNTVRTLAKKYKVYPGLILKILEQNKIKRRDQGPIPFKEKIKRNDIENIIERYKKGESSISIGSAYSTSPKNIRELLRKNGIKINDVHECHRLYSANHNYFNKINSREKKYWIGFLISDGFVTDRNEIGITSVDKEHIEKFRTAISSNHKIFSTFDKKFRASAYMFSICSPQLVSDVKKFGIIPRKSLVATPPQQIKNDKDFWRGVIDGDGTLRYFFRGKRKNPAMVVGLAGTYSMIKNFSDYIYKITGDINKIEKVPDTKNLFIIRYSSKNSVYKIVFQLYNDAPVALERKLKIAEKILNIV